MEPKSAVGLLPLRCQLPVKLLKENMKSNSMETLSELFHQHIQMDIHKTMDTYMLANQT